MPLEDSLDLFEAPGTLIELGPGAKVLPGFAIAKDRALLNAVAAISAASPFRHMVTPGGWRMSVAMTSCGRNGWVTDGGGYRYDPVDPETGRSWAAMPPLFSGLARQAAEQAGFEGFAADSCLINRYAPGARLTLHQDKNERDLGAPVVSVSLGLPATFLWGGLIRSERPRRLPLHHGDVVVWGGPARLTFHGVSPVAPGDHPLTGGARINLTFRRAR